PADGGLVLSDDVLRLFTVHCALARQHLEDKFVLLDTTSLTAPAYHSALSQRYKTNWPVLFNAVPPGAEVTHVTLLQLLQHMSLQKPLYYLHPSFGYYFEAFYAVPHKAVFQLVLHS